MKKITGVKSVDFTINAKGEGVVNWNGPTTIALPNKSTVDNHTLPKLRGYSNLTGKVKEGTGYKYIKKANEIDFNRNPLYIGVNCIKHALFRDQSYDLHFANGKNVVEYLLSLSGLVRGYVIASTQNKRKSCLYLSDFVDQLGNGNFEQMGRSGGRDSTSFFSKTTFGTTEYHAHGSISVEDLQFISLDKKFDRQTIAIKDGEGIALAAQLEAFIKTLTDDETVSEGVVVSYSDNYVRSGTIYKEGEVGMLLNSVAVGIVISVTLELIKELFIRQAGGYMYVDDIEVDYNDSNKYMRILRDPESISSVPESEYAEYYYDATK